MEGILKAVTGQSYGLFNKKGNVVIGFEVLNPRLRREKLDPLQGTWVNFEKNIEPLLVEEKAN